ncbi:hypothetical protein [Primorskyibacter sp. S187A]|uniref:hypothetical protein n=1 Tax=Primorskyibacter sp. S187A TaxID=3415130 RepID=UPI003C7C0252
MTLHSLIPDGGDYVVGAPITVPSLQVIGSRTVVRQGMIEEWVEVEAAGQRGWVQYQAGTSVPLLDRAN